MPAKRLDHHSLAVRLAMIVLGVCALLFGAALAYNYMASRAIIVEQAEENSRTLGREVANHIAAQLRPVEQVVRNIALALEDASLTSGEVTSLAQRVVQSNDDIFAMAIAFEPFGMDQDRLFFAPYCHRTDNGVRVTELGGPDYRYFYKDWYQLPRELNGPVWTEPYFDSGGGGVMMTTYAAPFYRLHHGQRRFAGVVTADIPLSWMQRMARGTKLYDTGYTFLISRNGTFIHHPLKALMLNHTIFSLAEERGDTELWNVGRDMTEGGTAFLERVSVKGGVESFLFYTPLHVGGWSLGMLFPRDEVLQKATTLSRNLLLMGALGFLLLAGAVLWAAGGVTRPLRRLSAAAREIAGGNLDAAVPPPARRDEVGELAEAFDHMRGSLRQHMRELRETTAQKERIESELRIARDIQMGILPKLFPAFPEHEEFDVFASIEPAKAVGGDLYDFFFIDDRHFCFLVGDVSDKGVPAAFFMAVTKTLLKAVAPRSGGPADILEKVNNDLAEENDSCMFVTLFLGILDIDTGEVRYANAGHNPPMLLRDRRARLVPPMNEPMAGAMPGMTYTERSMTLRAGDVLFLYTDGVTEAMDHDQGLFSEERLRELLASMEDTGVQRVVAEVDLAIKHFTGGASQSDDITMLALQYKGSGR
ncbi:sigma-B regulation protein RsbU (phosphoserine phosphatase) [Paucidesulfovibrio gracilis DSM 16080]|uniref:Sigma-B regulation protein RsbU (Phosphoserine phosphatase) n=1 Tax=Paucidesulfovibrio gracilis DSM 16080 TaxID=1121449 RepID=A0A1T4WZD9_9BACT|nr:SpoIIE family protein phosphatase [Paucidesulfovibrio gracilis]SKA81961.1 sigma-B regulation protein RsbU (phosphoserine phosphatase) [Paucidesulfovibrio gracilis DSM 16080]